MTENTPSPLGNVISIDDERIKNHEHEILRRDRDRGRATAPCIVEPVDGHAAGRRREIDVLHEGAGEEVHAARAQPRD